MPEEHFLKIMRFGLIGEAENGDSFRHVVFRDIANNKEAEILIYKKKNPSLWADIEQLEHGKTLPPCKGYITSFQGNDMVVLGDESLEEAFAKQQWKLDLKKKITRTKADRLRKESEGYITNLTHRGALEISWRNIDPEAKLIKFRNYEGEGKFSLSGWYEICDK